METTKQLKPGQTVELKSEWRDHPERDRFWTVVEDRGPRILCSAEVEGAWVLGPVQMVFEKSWLI